MFRADLKAALKEIFLVKKVTFDRPADDIEESKLVAAEQETLFVDVKASPSSIKDGHAWCRVQGQCFMYGPANVMTHGFFHKRIQKAGHEATKKFFFFQIDQNLPRFQNVNERAFSFVYFWDGQHDPATGSITSIEFTEGD